MKNIRSFPPGSVVTYFCPKGGIRNGWVFKTPYGAFNEIDSFVIPPKTPCVILSEPFRTTRAGCEYLVLPIYALGTTVQYFMNVNYPMESERLWYEVE